MSKKVIQQCSESEGKNTVVNVLNYLAEQLVKIAESSKKDEFLDLNEVMRRTTLKKDNIYRKMRDGAFPHNEKTSEGSVAWRASEIQSYIALGPQKWAEVQRSAA
ncbi:helix-turn-helix transcriptional regulator [Pseudoalteromonas obscura]|uniref:AlpA family phage regulatory protein n=1 Tax=Pseudoalteromonas obscura TaxID=3048491 RepID=A0ABT7EJN8_9GAMM|nr:AlpA family phage regulatory protein [Pseudoalteromonas sp. P94(2023)]MDK2595232.1 AlpA family phage regulatory protein [Pseudoalteromonas sp. P94(2023)]